MGEERERRGGWEGGWGDGKRGDSRAGGGGWGGEEEGESEKFVVEGDGDERDQKSVPQRRYADLG